MPLYEVHWTEVYEASREATIEADNAGHLEELVDGMMAIDSYELEFTEGYITYLEEVVPKTYLATFLYPDTRGQDEPRSAIIYREEAFYYKAVCLTHRAYRTFRKEKMKNVVLNEVDLNHEDYISH